MIFKDNYASIDFYLVFNSSCLSRYQILYNAFIVLTIYLYLVIECHAYKILNESDRSVNYGTGTYSDNTRKSAAEISAMWKGASWYRYNFKNTINIHFLLVKSQGLNSKYQHRFVLHLLEN